MCTFVNAVVCYVSVSKRRIVNENIRVADAECGASSGRDLFLTIQEREVGVETNLDLTQNLHISILENTSNIELNSRAHSEFLL